MIRDVSSTQMEAGLFSDVLRLLSTHVEDTEYNRQLVALWPRVHDWQLLDLLVYSSVLDRNVQ